MGKFDKAGSNKTFDKVGKKEAEKAQVIVVVNINNENLIDNPENGEDISFTEDLELSMKENGFTDPIEVTDFEMEPGKYMIISGHRRRSAGVKMGISVFPALIRHFNNRQEVKNYTLLSNSQRDSAKDPFLFSKRYKMHENYLNESGFTGNKREEIAKRLGLSIQQADRYNMMNKIILPVWDMIRKELVGMSSVQPMAAHTEDEQNDIYLIMNEALDDGNTLTRDTMKVIIDNYRKGKKKWNEMIKNEEKLSQDLSSYEETKEEDEIVKKERKSTSLNEEEKKSKRAKDIMSAIHKLDANLKDDFVCEDEKSGEEMLNAMSDVMELLISQIQGISKEYGGNDKFKKKFQNILNILKQYVE